MNKKVLIILICMIMILGVTGCKNSKNKFDIGNVSDVKISQSDVTLSIKEGTLTNEGATLILTNNSDKNYQYGYPYAIEIKKDGKWHYINAQLDFILPALHLLANESKEIELNWKSGYGTLPEGTYRIIKSIDYEKEEGQYETFNVAVEFTIKKDLNSSDDFDFYITKPQTHTDIRYNEYYTSDNNSIYLAGNIKEFYIKENDKDITLKTYLSTAFQTIDDGIKNITNKLELKETLQDGEVQIYKSKNKDISMIICNTTKNNKNILVGDYSMKYNENDCKN